MKIIQLSYQGDARYYYRGMTVLFGEQRFRVFVVNYPQGWIAVHQPTWWKAKVWVEQKLGDALAWASRALGQ
jgi:hypothetical protein